MSTKITTFNKIIDLLTLANAEFEIAEHEPVYTSEQAASIRGLGLKSGAKSLLLKINSDFKMFVLPGDQKMDMRKVKRLVSAKKIRFATPAEVENITGTQIGAVYPFGIIAGVDMYVDKKLAENEVIAFNPGLHHKSIIMKYEEYAKVTRPKLVDFTEDIDL